MVNTFFCFSIHPPRPLLYKSLVLHTILEICRVHGASSLLPPGHRYPLMSRKAPVLMESHPRRPSPRSVLCYSKHLPCTFHRVLTTSPRRTTFYPLIRNTPTFRSANVEPWYIRSTVSSNTRLARFGGKEEYEFVRLKEIHLLLKQRDTHRIDRRSARHLSVFAHHEA